MTRKLRVSVERKPGESEKITVIVQHNDGIPSAKVELKVIKWIIVDIIHKNIVSRELYPTKEAAQAYIEYLRSMKFNRRLQTQGRLVAVEANIKIEYTLNA